MRNLLPNLYSDIHDDLIKRYVNKGCPVSDYFNNTK
jgi:hypothetical protein